MTARPDRWEKAADRDLARRQRDAGPLFAPLVERQAPSAIRERAERIVGAHAAAIARGHADAESRGQAARITLAEHVTAEELAAIDRDRATCPASGEYTADVYCGECRRRGLPYPGREAYEAVWTEVARLEAEEAQRERAREAARGEQLDLPSGVRIALPRARIEEMSPGEQAALEEAAERAAQEHEHAVIEAAEDEAAVPRRGLTAG